MVRKGNGVAQLRRNELQHLERLLGPFRVANDNVAPLEMVDNETTSQLQPGLGYASEVPTPSFMTNNLSFNSMSMPWDAVFGSEHIAANHEQILELAEQFDVENFNSAFFFDA